MQKKDAKAIPKYSNNNSCFQVLDVSIISKKYNVKI
jgi:hypothetical protein